MTLSALVLLVLLGGATSARVHHRGDSESKADAAQDSEEIHSSEATRKMSCCCKSWTAGQAKCEDGKGQHYQECIAFHKQKPKCCQTMDRCEAASSWSAKWRFQAASNLCTGQLTMSATTATTTTTTVAQKIASQGDLDADDVDAFLAGLGLDEAPQFFEAINTHPNSNPAMMSRDYTIIVDRSGSMNAQEETHVPQKLANRTNGRFHAGRQRMSLWKEAEAALTFLADAAVREDPDGISLIFFDHTVNVLENVRDANQIMNEFHNNRPNRGTTRTDLALAEAVTPDTLGRAETILVITDGKPNDQGAVEDVIVNAARQLCRDEDLSITFIQVGSDPGAEEFLEYLDDGLEKKHGIFDIVDTMSKETMQTKSFLDVIAMSIQD